MAIAHDVDSNANSGASAVASLTWSHTCTGTSLLLVVGLSWTGINSTMTTITHAGNNPTGTTGIINSSTTYHSQIWWWVNPTTGAQNIIATPSLTVSLFGGGASFTGVDQTGPITEARSATGSSFGVISSDIKTMATNSYVFNHLGMANATSTIAASDTQAYNQFNATAARTAGGEYAAVATNGLVNSNWTISGSSNREWGNWIVAIKPADSELISSFLFNNRGLRPHPFSPGLAR